jgi:hypothetical protein
MTICYNSKVIMERAGILPRIRFALYVIFDSYFVVVTKYFRSFPPPGREAIFREIVSEIGPRPHSAIVPLDTV